MPALENISTTHFLRLQLIDADPAIRSVNSYWLSTKPDVLDFSKSNWNITPCKSFADYTELTKLPKVKLECESLGVSHDAADDDAKFRVANTSEAIAFMVRLKLNRGAGGEELLPIRWQDNYFMLLPGEKREISARYFPRDAAGSGAGGFGRLLQQRPRLSRLLNPAISLLEIDHRAKLESVLRGSAEFVKSIIHI